MNFEVLFMDRGDATATSSEAGLIDVCVSRGSGLVE